MSCRWSAARNRWETEIWSGVSAEACGHDHGSISREHGPESEREQDFDRLVEEGRRLASEREDLLAKGVPDDQLVKPVHPHAGKEGGAKWCGFGRHAVEPDASGRCPDHHVAVEEWD